MDAISQTSQLATQSAAADALKASAAKMKDGGPQDLTKAKTAAQSFEAFFVGQMMEYMTEGLKSDGVFGGGYAEDTWRSVMNQEYGKEIAKSGRLGISDSVMRAMVQMQEKRSKKAADSDAPQSADAPADASSDTTTYQAAAAAGTLGARAKSVIA
jgi:flagellar protein FlgJ